MRPALVSLFAALLAAGCVGTSTTESGAKPANGNSKSPAATKPARSLPAPAPVIEPVAAFTGKIVLVNGPLKYVVIEGVIGRLPPVDQSLNVYRDGQKVGVVVVSNQMRGSNYAADLTLGDARTGDLVRSD